MSGTVWIKHPELGAVSEVPESALPTWRQSGWDLLTDDELAERDQAAVDERAAAEAWMQEIAENARAVQAPPPPGLVDVPPSAPPPEQPDEDAVGRQTTKEIG
jgi:hypothetical protein